MNDMDFSTLLIIILALFAIGSWPVWPHSQRWSYRPVIGIGILFLVVLTLKWLKYI